MKSIVYKISLLATTLALSTIAFSDMGGRDGGGGTSVYCKIDGDRFPVSGVYFFDYAVSKNPIQDWYVSGASAEDHLTRVTEKVLAELPLLFSDKKAILNFTSNVKSNWTVLPQGYKLNNSDAPDKTLLPKNCARNTVKQVVTFKDGKYYYVKDSFDELEKTGVQQISALYIHELFRQAEDYERGKTTEIAKWNQALHTKYWLSNNLESNSKLYLENGLLTFNAIHINEKISQLLTLKDQLDLANSSNEEEKNALNKKMNTITNQIKDFFNNGYQKYSTVFRTIAGTAEVVEKSQKCDYVNAELPSQDSINDFAKLSRITVLWMRKLIGKGLFILSDECEKMISSIDVITDTLPLVYAYEYSRRTFSINSCEHETARRVNKLHEDVSRLCKSMQLFERY